MKKIEPLIQLLIRGRIQIICGEIITRKEFEKYKMWECWKSVFFEEIILAYIKCEHPSPSPWLIQEKGHCHLCGAINGKQEKFTIEDELYASKLGINLKSLLKQIK